MSANQTPIDVANTKAQELLRLVDDLVITWVDNLDHSTDASSERIRARKALECSMLGHIESLEKKVSALADLGMAAAEIGNAQIESVDRQIAESSKDLLEIVRTLAVVAEKVKRRDDGYANLALSDDSPLMIAARKACIARGFTAGGLSIEPAITQPNDTRSTFSGAADYDQCQPLHAENDNG